MRIIRLGVVLLCAYVLVATLLPNAPVAADQAKSCDVLPVETLTAVQQACSTAGANSVCYGADTSTVTASDSSNLTFGTQGDQVDLAKVTTVSTSGLKPVTASNTAGGDASKWGVAMLHIQADLPADNQGISAVLFGDTTITSKVRAGGTDLTTLPVQTVDVDPVVLRTGAGPNYPRTATLYTGANAVVDGRNQDGSWVRVRVDGAVGWAWISQVTVNGDVNSLSVLDPTDLDISFLYKNPMQAFTLSTGKSSGACGDAPSGLLLQLGGKQATHLLINGTDIGLTPPATALLRSVPKDRFEVLALQGSVTIAGQGNSLSLDAGEWVRLRIGGKDGLTLSAAPNGKTTYPFSALLGTPLSLLANSVPCTVGLTAKEQAIPIRLGPGSDWGILTALQPDNNYTASGWAADSDGAPWWKLNADNGTQAWIAQSSVYSVGACNLVAKVDAPGAPVASNVGSSGSGNDSSAGSGDSSAPIVSSFAPTAKTIWSADPGLDKLSGTCKTGPLNYCSQMIALTPSGNSFMWKGQALKQFHMLPVKPNVYSYSGPNGTGDGHVTMVMAFTSPTRMVMTETLILSSEPSCIHTHVFVATFLR